MARRASRKSFLTTSALTLGLMTLAHNAMALDELATPTGEVVVGGAATFDRPQDGMLNINQSTDRAVINWDSFNIGSKATTEFFQPNSGSLTVNRVVSRGTDPTEILGTMKANGQVMVLDRNGVLFGKDSKIDVGGIVASTGNVDNAAVMNGDSKLTLSEFTDNTVQNDGAINIQGDGLAALVGRGVVNNGKIYAPLGKVALASGGESATVDLYGDGLVELTVGGTRGKAMVEQAGTVDGAVVAMTAADARNTLDTVINMSGVTRATSATVVGGKIILNGGDRGVVKVSGALAANGKTGGGSIKVKGENVQITDTASLSADATQTGNGGTVNIWGDKAALSSGALSARGGAVSGNGGSVELSADQAVGYAGTTDTTATNGATGSFLIDPKNIRIGTYNTATMTSSILADIFAGGTYDTVSVDQQALANTLRTSDVNLWASNSIYTTTNIDLSTYSRTVSCGFLCFTTQTGITSRDLTLSAPTINLSHNVILGTGKLGIYDIAGGVSPLGLGLVNTPIGGIQVDTVNLNGTISRRSTVGGATSVAGSDQIGGQAHTVNVLSNAAKIQQGIAFADGALPGNAVVNVAADTYNENVVVNKSINLVGAKSALFGDNAARGTDESVIEANGGDGIRITADHVRVAGFTVQNADNGVSVSGANFTNILNNVINNSANDGILVVNGSTIATGNQIDGATRGVEFSNTASLSTSSNNTIFNIDEDGILADHANGAQLTGNVIYDTGRDAIRLTNTTGMAMIRDNTIGANAFGVSQGGDNVGGNGVTVDRSYAMVFRNKISEAANDGVAFSGTTTGSTATSNTIFDVGGNGISNDFSNWSNLTGNVIFNTGNDGIRLTNSVGINTIRDNLIGFNGFGEAQGNGNIGGDGIYSNLSYAMITRNKVNGAGGNGVTLTNTTTGSTVSDVTVSNVGGIGIDADHANWSNLTGNVVFKTGLDGIRLTNSQGINNIRDNLVGTDAFGVVQGNGNIQGDGIASDGSYVLITRNKVTQATGNGVNLTNTTTGSTVSDVTVSSVGGTGISADHANWSNLTGNVVFKTGGDGIRLTNSTGTNIIRDNLVGLDAFGVVQGDNNVEGNGISSDRSYVQITRNKVTQATGDGVVFTNTTTGSTASDNTVWNVLGDGIGADFANWSNLTGNVVYKTGGNGIRLTNSTGINTIADNTIGTDAFETQQGDNNIQGNGIVTDNSQNVTIFRNKIRDAGTSGIQISGSDAVTIDSNRIISSGAYGMYVQGPSNGSVKLVGNTSTDNPVGARFESGLIDMTGATNVFNGGNIGLQFDPLSLGFGLPAFQTFAEGDFPEFLIPGFPFIPVFADLALVGDTIGTTEFNGQSSYYVQLANTALFNPGAPTLEDGFNATYDGFNPASTGDALTQDQYDGLAAKFYHYPNDNGLGLFFFGTNPSSLSTLTSTLDLTDQNVITQYGQFAALPRAFSITLLGLPRVPGTPATTLPPAGNPTTAGALNDITPAAGGDNDTPSSPQQLASVEPAAGGNGQSQSSNCWSQASISSSASTVVNYSASPEQILSDAAACGPR